MCQPDAMSSAPRTPGSNPAVPAMQVSGPGEAADADRRVSGKRARARDRLMDRATRPYQQTRALSDVDHVENLLLFIDDDLRETALAISNIESYLISTLAMLEREQLSREAVQALASDQDILDHVDLLNETLESLRRRMSRLATNLR